MNPTGGEIRGCDDGRGCGNFGASRDSGTRTHPGTVYVATRGQDVRAVTGGTISKIGYPYSDDLSFRYVEINAGNGYVAREFYVEPATGIVRGATVSPGDVIGTNQSLGRRYPGITDHVHVEIRYNGNLVNPATLSRLP